MRTIEELDNYFTGLQSTLGSTLPDGIQEVNLETLASFNLLSDGTHSSANSSPHVPSHYFHVNDAEDKITLYNDNFVVWIVPECSPELETTVVIIASDNKAGINPELAFSTSGVFNSSQTVLRLVERYLDDIEETQTVISTMSVEE